MKCEIIKDLLPSYIDGLTSSESNTEIEEHLPTCPPCKEILEQMKTEVTATDVALNKEKIKPFKKLNRRVLKSVLLTLTVCILAIGAYFYFFAIGWMVNSEDVNITYSYDESSLLIDFELTSGNVLSVWDNHGQMDHGEEIVFTFRECFSSVLDDRGEQPNQFFYGTGSTGDESGKHWIKTFSDSDHITLHFKDKTETLYLKEIAEELGLQ